jgi:predicted cobalt transporter CbtA
MDWALLRRGLAVGALAGLLAGAFAFSVGEPRVQKAIDFEEAHSAATLVAHAGDGPGARAGDDAPVSRDGQRGGLFLATLLYGLFAGGLFALAFGPVRRRFGKASDWFVSTRFAAVLFVAVFLVPFLKYPANPPAVGDPETIGKRTALYLVMVAISLLALMAAFRVRRSVEGEAARALAAVGTYVGVVLAAFFVLPWINEVPGDFPASLLWEFRLSSLGTQLVMWSAIGAGFGWVGSRA